MLVLVQNCARHGGQGGAALCLSSRRPRRDLSVVPPPPYIATFPSRRHHIARHIAIAVAVADDGPDGRVLDALSCPPPPLAPHRLAFSRPVHPLSLRCAMPPSSRASESLGLGRPPRRAPARNARRMNGRASSARPRRPRPCLNRGTDDAAFRCEPSCLLQSLPAAAA